jgi:hypothetical protein
MTLKCALRYHSGRPRRARVDDRLCPGGRFAAPFRAVLCVAALCSSTAARAENQPSLDEIIAGFERQLDSRPQLVALAALKRDFPEDYQLGLARAKSRLPKEPLQSSGAAVGAVFLEEFGKAANDVVQRDADEMAHADLPQLDRFEATVLDVLRALQATSPRSCVDYAVDNAIGGDKTAPADDLLIEKNIAARLDALANGKAHKIKRSEPPEEAFDAWVKATAALGMSAQALERLKLGKTVVADAVAEQCQSFITAHQALAALPTEPRTNLLANEFIPIYYGRQ